MIRHSDVLNQQITINDNGSITTEDGAEYKTIELSKIKNISDEGKRKVHNVKKWCRGDVVDFNGNLFMFEV